MADVAQSWYTKYRPRTMTEYSGNALKNIVSKRFIKRENFPHTIMIKGTRGCGKTTLGRILSKYYQCTNPNEDGTPCEECEMCTSINEILIDGNSTEVECPGVVEVDATTANGKEAIQQVIEDAIQPPIYTKYKVIIFDECHRITPQAQNSLLKIIEDIPQHLICIFCTTNDEQVLQTVKSRMQLSLEARRQSVKDMAERLMTISKLESLTVSRQALEAIARKGDRVPRECINILENVAKTYGGEVTVENVSDYLGGVSSDLYFKYFEASNTSLESILLFLKELKANDVKLNDFVSGLMAFTLDSMYIKHGISLEDYPIEYVKAVKKLFDMYTSSDFDMLLQVLENLSNNLSSDNAKNELILTTTAMRISKINLLANGLAKEQNNAIEENKLSLIEHSKMLKANNSKISEKLKMDLSIENISESFDDVKTVDDTADLFDGIKIPELKPIFDTDNTSEKQDSLGDKVDSFFEDF